VASAAHKERAHVSDYLGRLRAAHEQLVLASETVAGRYQEEPEIQNGLATLIGFSTAAIESLGPFIEKYGEPQASEPQTLREALLPVSRAGAYGLLCDLHDLSIVASEAHLSLTIVTQAALALRDEQLLAVCRGLDEQSSRQQAWLLTQIKHRAAHTLVVPS